MEDITSNFIFNIKKKIKIQKSIKPFDIYPIKNYLSRNIPKNKYSKIFFCIFKINTFSNNLMLPSLEYLLYKYNTSNEMIFPFINIEKYAENNDDNLYKFYIKNYSNFLLKELDYKNTKLTNVGYIEIGSNLFCFLKLNQDKLNYLEVYNKQNNNNLWWATLSEINNSKLINYNINDSVTYIFKKFNFLKDFNSSNHFKEQILYICESKSNIINILQNNFANNSIFKPLDICIKDAIKNKIKNPVLIRCCIFSKKIVTKSINIKNLFKISPISLHCIKFKSNNSFKIK